MSNFTFHFHTINGVYKNSLLIDFIYNDNIYRNIITTDDIRNFTSINNLTKLQNIIISAKENKDGWSMSMKIKRSNVKISFINIRKNMKFELKFNKLSKFSSCSVM